MNTLHSLMPQHIKNKVLGIGIVALLALSATTNAQADTFFFHNDHLGTPQAVSDSSSQVVWQAEYSPFGEVTETVSLIEQNLRFPGQYFDAETGLYYNYFRDSDPSTGRYLESDPIGFASGQFANYSYTNGNPISQYDPYGLLSITNPATWPTIPQGVVDIVAGFGDGVSFGITRKIREWQGTNGEVNECSEYYRASKTAGNFALPSATVLKIGYWAKVGAEFPRNSKRFRVAPFGNRTNHPTGRWPHYHRRVTDKSGKTLPGQSPSRHRPWDKKTTDKSFRDRF